MTHSTDGRFPALPRNPECRPQRQLRELPGAAAISHPVSDPARAQRNRLARDRIVAGDAVSSALRLGIRVIEVDGTHDAGAIADIVADHFRPYQLLVCWSRPPGRRGLDDEGYSRPGPPASRRSPSSVRA
jgi:hypothetical protein